MKAMSKSRWKGIPDNLKDRVIDDDKAVIEPPKKPSKYHNVKCEYNGIRFDSKKEMNFYITLMVLKNAGQIKEIELRPEFPYVINYSLPEKDTNHYLLGGETLSRKAKYIGDFRVTYTNGQVAVFDVKGVKTAIYRRKKKIVERLYGIEIIEE
jgi:hypothetical protein